MNHEYSSQYVPLTQYNAMRLQFEDSLVVNPNTYQLHSSYTENNTNFLHPFNTLKNADALSAKDERNNKPKKKNKDKRKFIDKGNTGSFGKKFGSGGKSKNNDDAKSNLTGASSHKYEENDYPNKGSLLEALRTH